VGLDIVQNFQTLAYFMISPSLANSKCLFGELEKYLTNDYMTISRLLTMSKVEKL